MSRGRRYLALVLGAILAWSGSAAAETPWKFTHRPLQLESGRQDGAGEEARLAYSTTVQVLGAPILRVSFAEADLGRASYVILRSAEDGAEQRFDAGNIDAWGRTSAYFNGERVEVSLYVAPEDRGVFVQLGEAIAVEPAGPATQCGPTDDRIASNDHRVGRANGNCTAWRIANGYLLTAGHCVDADPDQGGPMLPNGVLDWSNSTIIEFRVPASDAAGNIVAAAPADQFPVVASSVVWRFDGNGQGLGKDWAVFRVGANTNTGLLPHQVYGFPFRITRELPANNATVRVTGFGTDTGTANQTNQTATGPFTGEIASGADIRLDYRVDTEGGNSGGPIIWESNALAIGIHANGGCDTTGGGNNSGTSFEVDALETAINNAPGTNTIYVDAGHPLVPAFEGTLMRPLGNLVAGINQVVSGGRISVVTGTYGLTAGTTLTKPMTILAPAGTVTVIGQ